MSHWLFIYLKEIYGYTGRECINCTDVQIWTTNFTAVGYFNMMAFPETVVYHICPWLPQFEPASGTVFHQFFLFTVLVNLFNADGNLIFSIVFGPLPFHFHVGLLFDTTFSVVHLHSCSS